MKKLKFLFIAVALSFAACNTNHQIVSQQHNNSFLYQQSIEDAMSPAPDKVYDKLVTISPDNDKLKWKNIDGEDYLLVVSWKQNISFYKPYLDSSFYNTGIYPIWITTAPELKERMKKENAEDINLRLKQLLGLPPNSVYSYFIEFWVKPADLFRPCPDQEITDGNCDLCFPQNTDSMHINWINENRISRYYSCELYDKYPWTQLGYTYDWNSNNKSHVGLSEFVIGRNKNIVINAIYSTKEYLGVE